MAESKLQTLVGNDLADDYVRTYAPKSRWGDTWSLLKANFTKFVIINMLTLLFFVPSAVIIYFRIVYLTNIAALYPFSANVGIAIYAPSAAGMAEKLTFSADVIFYAALVLSSLVAAVGLSGGAYSVKKMINSYGQFTLKGYFHGVKLCYFNTLLPLVAFMIFLFATFMVSDWAALEIALGKSAAGPVTAKVFIIIATVIVGVFALWLFAVGVSYKVSLVNLFKNSFVLFIGTILQSVFMAAFALLPVWLMVAGIYSVLFLVLGILVLIFIGFSLVLLIWFAYTQWVFDSFITPAIANEKQAARAKMSPKELQAAKEEDARSEARELLAAGRSYLICRPIKPIGDESTIKPVPAAFTRGDVLAARDARAALEGDVADYCEQHKNDPKYVEYNKLFAEREKALSDTDKKGKKKKISADNLLK